MSGKKHNDKHEPQACNNVAEEAEKPEVMDVLDTAEDENAEEAVEEAGAANLAAELDEARAQIEKDRNDYLLLAADFDNYRKRTMREKADLLKNAAERVLLGLLPIVDDFERGIAAIPEKEDDACRQGLVLIYNKLNKFLESNGVKAMESTGAPFDADYHDAIATIPAPEEDSKGKVIDTTVKGYMINDKVLRHAKVVVGE